MDNQQKEFLKYWLSILTIWLLPFGLSAQTAPVHVYNNDLYQFLDELNSAGYSDQTFIAKPLNSKQVSDILFSINSDSIQNDVLKNRLQFYKQQFVLEHSLEYAPQPFAKSIFKTLSRQKGFDAIYYGKDKVAFTMNPIIGIEYYNNKNGQIIRRKVGGDFKLYIDKFTLYGSVRDNYESQAYSSYTSLDPHEGSLYKYNSDGSVEFSESRGGFSYNLGWGEIAFAKDHLKWGYGTFSTNILDANVPSYPHLKLRLYPKPWIKFEYIHASLQSNVIDSASVYQVGNGMHDRYEFHNKYLASNLLSLRFKKKTWFSLGNSIVYSQDNIEPSYLIPLAFYKSIDHYVANRNNYRGGNAQMFAAISTRVIPKLHLYSTLFVDEISMRRMFDSEAHSNWFSINSGFQLSNLIPNTTFTLEYVRTNAMVYKHFIETTTYSNSYYTLGHNLKDNAHQVSVMLTYAPTWWLDVKGVYQFSEKGPDIKDDRVTRNPETGYYFVQGIQFLESKQWVRSRYQLQCVFKPIAHVRGTLSVQYLVYPVPNQLYQIPFYSGNNVTFATGLSYDF